MTSIPSLFQASMGSCLSSQKDPLVVAVVVVPVPITPTDNKEEEDEEKEHIWYDSLGQRFEVPETPPSFEGRPKRLVYIADIVDPQRRAKHDVL